MNCFFTRVSTKLDRTGLVQTVLEAVRSKLIVVCSICYSYLLPLYIVPRQLLLKGLDENMFCILTFLTITLKMQSAFNRTHLQQNQNWRPTWYKKQHFGAQHGTKFNLRNDLRKSISYKQSIFSICKYKDANTLVNHSFLQRITNKNLQSRPINTCTSLQSIRRFRTRNLNALSSNTAAKSINSIQERVQAPKSIYAKRVPFHGWTPARPTWKSTCTWYGKCTQIPPL